MFTHLKAMIVIDKQWFEDKGFKVLETGAELQIASMTLEAGETSGEFGNEHPDSEQLIYVIEGQCEIRVDDEIVELASGDSFLIPKDRSHQVRNSGSSRLMSLNVYAPPAY